MSETSISAFPNIENIANLVTAKTEPKMKDIVLYCKSYYGDVLRAKRLVESVRQYNHSQLAFYLSCPASDLPLFKTTIGDEGVVFLADEEIIAANPSLDQKSLDAMPGGLSQQIVKSEFWRLGLCENYLCLDSDCYFIRNFNQHDFIAPNGTPYTVINQTHELRLFGAIHDHQKIADNADVDCRAMMKIMQRTGGYYSFGPIPVVWSRRVWSDLAEKFLAPKKMNFMDAIKLCPSELRWYGEALLKYRSIELLPVEALFRCYHYEHQYRVAKRAGETNQALSEVYLGVCAQSNWEHAMAYGDTKKSLLSRFGRMLKRRVLGRLA